MLEQFTKILKGSEFITHLYLEQCAEKIYENIYSEEVF